MSDHKQNWRNYYPPMIPIYFMDYDALKDMLEKNPMAVNNEGLEMMLGYFEEFEKYEKAALVRDAQWKREMFAGEDHPSRTTPPTVVNQPKTPELPPAKMPKMPPPNDGHEWFPSEDGTHWVRKMTKDEHNRIFNNQNDINKDGENEDQSTDGFNPFH